MARRMTDEEYGEAIDRTQTREELSALIDDLNSGRIVLTSIVEQPAPRVVAPPRRTNKPSRRERQRKLLTRNSK